MFIILLHYHTYFMHSASFYVAADSVMLQMLDFFWLALKWVSEQNLHLTLNSSCICKTFCDAV